MLNPLPRSLFMTTPSKFKSLQSDTCKVLSDCAKQAAAVASPKVITFHFCIENGDFVSLDKTLREEICKATTNDKYVAIYVFECINSDNNTRQASWDAYLAAKNAGGRAYARSNALSNVLYVGSSRSMPKRFSEHLGHGNKNTYAMHLIHWAKGLNLEIEFTCALYAASTNNKVIQAMEDCLWESLKPMLGRKGSK